MVEPTVDNRTDFAVAPSPQIDKEGLRLLAMVKATFELGEDGTLECAPKSRNRPLRFADLPWQKDQPESIAYPADVCLQKPGTDVVFVARAHAPGGRPVPSFDARVEVGPLARSLTVFGRRLWRDRGAGFTDPAPLDGLDLRYDFAWGGRDEEGPKGVVEEPRNPVGLGVAHDPVLLTHRPGPQIEDPAQRIDSARTAPPPAGIGVVGRSWAPRRSFAGTYDKEWQETRAPLTPSDFDDRFNLCASAGLVAQTPLGGGERVRLLNLTPGGGAVAFALPKVPLEIEIAVPGREAVIFAPILDTVLFDLMVKPKGKVGVVEMVWRAHVKAPRRMKGARVIVREKVKP